MKKSAGILVYKWVDKDLNFFLVHPGGPFFAKKDDGFWSIPKGEFEDNEEPLNAAIREFNEETGIFLEGDFHELNPVRLKSGKLVLAWALNGDIDSTNIVSNTFRLEWPPKSGKFEEFPEIDKACWFNIEEAGRKINPAQRPFLSDTLLIAKK